MDQFAPEDHTYHATKEELVRYKQSWMVKEIRMEMLEQARIHIIGITAQLFKKDAKCQLQILPHLPTFQDPNRSSIKVIALDYKEIMILIEPEEIPCEMIRGNFGGVTTNGMIGWRGTMTNGANLSRSSKCL